MGARLPRWWFELQDALCFIPAVPAPPAVQPALVMDRLDRHLPRDHQAGTNRPCGDELHPTAIGCPNDPSPGSEVPDLPADLGRIDHLSHLRSVAADALVDVVARRAPTVRVEPLVGGFVRPGAALVTVPAAAAVEPDLDQAPRKSLLPGINGRTTATIRIDRLGEALVNRCRDGKPVDVRMGTDGSVRQRRRDRAVVASDCFGTRPPVGLDRRA